MQVTEALGESSLVTVQGRAEFSSSGTGLWCGGPIAVWTSDSCPCSTNLWPSHLDSLDFLLQVQTMVLAAVQCRMWVVLVFPFCFEGYSHGHLTIEVQGKRAVGCRLLLPQKAAFQASSYVPASWQPEGGTVPCPKVCTRSWVSMLLGGGPS